MFCLRNTGQSQAEQESTGQDTDNFRNGCHGKPPLRDGNKGNTLLVCAILIAESWTKPYRHTYDCSVESIQQQCRNLYDRGGGTGADIC
jgi:hypothetical protein